MFVFLNKGESYKILNEKNFLESNINYLQRQFRDQESKIKKKVDAKFQLEYDISEQKNEITKFEVKQY